MITSWDKPTIRDTLNQVLHSRVLCRVFLFICPYTVLFLIASGTAPAWCPSVPLNSSPFPSAGRPRPLPSLPLEREKCHQPSDRVQELSIRNFWSATMTPLYHGTLCLHKRATNFGLMTAEKIIGRPHLCNYARGRLDCCTCRKSARFLRPSTQDCLKIQTEKNHPEKETTGQFSEI